jgi:hypothetical protein
MFLLMRNLILSLAILLPATLAAQCGSTQVTGNYGTAQGASGDAQYLVAMPQPSSCYNGQMVLFSHGYVVPGSPAGTWLNQLVFPDGTSLPALLNSMGYGFAASSYSKDGWAVPQGEQDTKALINVLQRLEVPALRYFVAGVSEGGLIATKLLEDNSLFAGGLAVCGVEGSFQRQINYGGDTRVLFDYFFPGILTSAGGSAINIPPSLMQNWFTTYAPAVRNALNANPTLTLQLMSTARIPSSGVLSDGVDAIVNLLAGNVFGTADTIATLGGNPFDNMLRIYHGSLNDIRLNARVARFAASPTAVTKFPQFDTTGVLHHPLVTLHNVADPTVLFEQETLYAAKALVGGSALQLSQLPALRYGHCNVTSAEAQAALGLLLLKVGQ